MVRLNVCTYVYQKVGSCETSPIIPCLDSRSHFPTIPLLQPSGPPPQGFLPPTAAKLPYVSRHPFMHPDTYLPPRPWARPHIIHPLVYLASYPLTHPCTNASTYPLNHPPMHASTHPPILYKCNHACTRAHPSTTQASSHVSLSSFYELKIIQITHNGIHVVKEKPPSPNLQPPFHPTGKTTIANIQVSSRYIILFPQKAQYITHSVSRFKKKISDTDFHQ